MPRHALKPSPNLARMLRQRRSELGWTTRDVVIRTKELGEPIPRVTLQKIEAGTQEPGVRRFYTLLRLYKLPFELIPDLLELESLAAEPPAETDPRTLVVETLAALERGDAGAALARVFALRTQAQSTHDSRKERQRALLTMSGAAILMGRIRLAHRIVEEVLAEPPDEEFLPLALLQCASCHADLGSMDVALGILSRAQEIVQDKFPHLEARVEHKRGMIHTERRDLDAARACLERAGALYSRYPDDEGNLARLEGANINLLIATGQFDEALDRARKALESAESRDQKILMALRHKAIGRCLYALGRFSEAIAAFQSSVGYSLISRDRTTQLQSQYWLYKTYAALRRPEEAESALRNAVDQLSRTDEVTAESRELHELLRTGSAHGRPKAIRRRRS